MATEQQIPFQFPSGRSLNYLLYGPTPTDIPSLLTPEATPSFATPEQYTAERNVAVLTTLEGYNLQLGRQQYDVRKIGSAYAVPDYSIDRAIKQAAEIKATAGKDEDNIVALAQKVGLGIILAVDAALLAMFASPTSGVLADAAAGGSGGSSTGSTGFAAIGSGGESVTIDPTYFGFEEATNQTLGISPYLGGPQVVTGEQALLLTGAPAASLTATGGVLGSVGSAIQSFFSKVSDFFVKGVVGTGEQALQSLVGSTPDSPFKGTPTTDQITKVVTLGGGGGGGLAYNPNTAVGDTGSGALVFFGVLAGVIVLILFLKRRG